eukprot:CAMPEP_0197588630 /NCGR_PEP_ID=MMETSP1326-20131121/9846_1 /TAXON_ID=1155430 /ORGANISM="Genus nov. species nov., Strain RCC2288" /LENGTH=128 /DNA_ID=CAMNT_0043153477 /DNA_START=230 /DNA_END=614 /DNA_ORIENTATION=+
MQTAAPLAALAPAACGCRGTPPSLPSLVAVTVLVKRRALKWTFCLGRASCHPPASVGENRLLGRGDLEVGTGPSKKGLVPCEGANASRIAWFFYTVASGAGTTGTPRGFFSTSWRDHAPRRASVRTPA